MSGELAIYGDRRLQKNLTVARTGGSKVFSDMAYASGFARSYIDEPYDLDYIGCHATHHIMARGGRLIAAMPKVSLPLSDTRKSIIRNARILDHEPEDPLRPVLLGLLSARTMPTDLRTNPVAVHILGNGVCYVQIYGEGYKTRIIPLELLQELSRMHIRPSGLVESAGQTLIRFSDEAGSIHIFYVCLILSMVK